MEDRDEDEFWLEDAGMDDDDDDDWTVSEVDEEGRPVMTPTDPERYEVPAEYQNTVGLLRSLARSLHDDLSVADDAADLIESLCYHMERREQDEE